jgi:hypothetical protein
MLCIKYLTLYKRVFKQDIYACKNEKEKKMLSIRTLCNACTGKCISMLQESYKYILYKYTHKAIT